MPKDWSQYKKPDMIRVGTRISRTLNAWLDDLTEETGVPKSTWIYFAIEQFAQQKDAINTMSLISEKIESLENMIKETSQKP